MELHGDNGALDLQVVKSFMYQLLKVSLLDKGVYATVAQSQHDPSPYRESPFVTIIESCTGISSHRIC